LAEADVAVDFQSDLFPSARQHSVRHSRRLLKFPVSWYLITFIPENDSSRSSIWCRVSVDGGCGSRRMMASCSGFDSFPCKHQSAPAQRAVLQVLNVIYDNSTSCSFFPFPFAIMRIQTRTCFFFTATPSQVDRTSRNNSFRGGCSAISTTISGQGTSPRTLTLVNLADGCLRRQKIVFVRRG